MESAVLEEDAMESPVQRTFEEQMIKEDMLLGAWNIFRVWPRIIND